VRNCREISHEEETCGKGLDAVLTQRIWDGASDLKRGFDAVLSQRTWDEASGQAKAGCCVHIRRDEDGCPRQWPWVRGDTKCTSSLLSVQVLEGP